MNTDLNSKNTNLYNKANIFKKHSLYNNSIGQKTEQAGKNYEQKELIQNVLYTNIVTYPAVRLEECRLRLCIMKDLTYEQIDKAIEILKKWAEIILNPFFIKTNKCQTI